MSRIRNSLARHPHSLEQAVAELIAYFGNTSNAAANCRVSKKALGAYANPSDRERNMPIDVVCDLEMAAGEPIVTRRLAARQGYLLHKIDTHPGHDRWHDHQRQIVRQASGLFLSLTELLDGGEISIFQAAALIEEIDETLAALVSLRSSLSEVSA